MSFSWLESSFLLALNILLLECVIVYLSTDLKKNHSHCCMRVWSENRLVRWEGIVVTHTRDDHALEWNGSCGDIYLRTS